MWGTLLKNAAALASEQASSLVGRVDEFASQGISTASQLLEKLDNLGNEEDKDASEEQEEDETHSPHSVPSESLSITPPSQSLQSLDSPADHPVEQAETEAVLTPPADDENVVHETTKEVSEANLTLLEHSLEASTVDSTPAAASALTTKSTDLKKYQHRIRKLEKEKAALEEETSNLQIAVVSISRELQEALSTNRKDHEREEWHKEKEDLMNRINQLEEKLTNDRHLREQVTSQQQLALSLLQEEKVTILSLWTEIFVA